MTYRAPWTEPGSSIPATESAMTNNILNAGVSPKSKWQVAFSKDQLAALPVVPTIFDAVLGLEYTADLCS